MRVLILPQPNLETPGTSGIDRVIEAYWRHLPQFGIDPIQRERTDADLIAVHAGLTPEPCDVAHCHGLYWTGDYDADLWQLQVNSSVISSIRHARQVTVPSAWVAETFQREMRFSPHVVPHGIEWREWQAKTPNGGYILYNKNREGDVCSSRPVLELARRFPNEQFITTFLPRYSSVYSNTDVIGLIPHNQMKRLVMGAGVYLSTTKETFGIGVLEAMASGVPILGFRYGGNVDLVEHGVNGYLAAPGEWEDLAEGLSYCLQHRDVLGENSREMAKRWTWESACEKVAEVYKMALDHAAPTVAIVIPVYNKTEGQIGRAIESACKQSYKGVTAIIVVDDGSDNAEAVETVARSYQGGDDRIRFHRQDNSGVSSARNKGIEIAGGAKYVCCLDADDALAPEFVSECVRELEEDRSLGIAYTKLTAVSPDGSTTVSKWPDEFNYDRQLKKQNQIPTACVFRRKMWERLGGYNGRWEGQGGAGAEDAEFWLRAGAFGWGAKLASRRPLFIYSLGGTVSANKDYVEPDWTSVWPWAGRDGDGMHPFASVATPHRFSHPVRQYDEPLVSVIIPVGPGHEKKVMDALDSLEHQTMRKWEAIVVDDTEDYHALGKSLKAYPYARLVQDVGLQSKGAGHARNIGVTASRAPFLIFLDADDWLYPTCIEKMLSAWNDTQAIAYTDYVGKSFVDEPGKLDPALRERMYYYDERSKEAVIGYRSAEYNCEMAQEQPRVDNRGNLYVWTNVTALIPKAWHNEIGGFDEAMTTWEDVDYHWRLAKAGKCYTRIPEELMVYQFHTGNRRERGRQEYTELLEYLERKYEEVEVAGCGSCPGRRSSPPPARNEAAQMAAASKLDEQMVMCKYIHPSRGSHLVIGAAEFESPPPGLPTRRVGGRYKIDYGYRSGGGQEQFYVHRDDVALNPNLFLPIKEEPAVKVPIEQRVEQPPPERIAMPKRERMPKPQSVTEIIQRATERAVARGESGISLPQAVAKEKPMTAREILESEMPPRPRPIDLQALPGIGPSTARSLEEQGIKSKADLLELGVEGLARLKGVGPARAEMVIDAVKLMPDYQPELADAERNENDAA